MASADLTARIGSIIDRHILPIFKGAPKVTVLVRHPDDAAGNYDVLVTSDDEAGVRAIVGRRTGRPPAEHTAAVSTLKALGYEWRGGALWEPPIGRMPAWAEDDLASAAKALASEARDRGVVLTIEQVPRVPLAMGNHFDVVLTRPAR